MKELIGLVTDRLGCVGWVRAVADTRIPGGPRLRYTLTSALIFCFALVALSGIAMTSVYNPSVNGAWGSVYWIEHHMTLGSLVRGVHLYASDAMIVLAVIQLTVLFLEAGYRAPREASWISIILLYLLLAGAGLTGYLLPWDQNGYWSTQVRLGIMGSTPGGDILRTLLVGGDELGTLALTRFYILHILVLPGAMGLLLWTHIAPLVRHGAPAKAEGEEPIPWWPFQAILDVVVWGIILGCILGLAVLVGVGLEAPADPASQFEARPEWSFLFLFQLLKYLKGPLMILGSVVLPGLATGFLVLLPWLERRMGRTEGPPAPALKLVYFGGLTAAIALSGVALMEDANSREYQEWRAAEDTRAERAQALAHQGGIDPAGRVVLLTGEKLYHDKGCASCHQRNAEDTQGPLLAGYGGAERIDRFLQDPNHEDLFGKTVFNEAMDPYEGSDEDRAALVAWLVQLGGASSVSPPTPEVLERAREIFEEECTDCHNPPEGTPRSEDWDREAGGPDLDGYQGYEWTRGVIRDATHPRFFGDELTDKDLENSMPPFLDLSSDELDLLTRWMLAGAPGAD